MLESSKGGKRGSKYAEGGGRNMIRPPLVTLLSKIVKFPLTFSQSLEKRVMFFYKKINSFWEFLNNSPI